MKKIYVLLVFVLMGSSIFAQEVKPSPKKQLMQITNTDEGWKIDQVAPFSLSPSSNGGVGIFMTRYFLSRSES